MSFVFKYLRGCYRKEELVLFWIVLEGIIWIKRGKLLKGKY